VTRVPHSDLEELRQSGYSAVISDCCDRLGLRGQTLTPGIVPVAGGGRCLAGFARPVRAIGVDTVPARPYGAEIDFIDSLEPDDVVVAATEAPVAFWGELFSTAARARGAAGAVIDGLIRDSVRIAALGWPVFATGTRPTDSLGRLSIAQADVVLTIRGVAVARGDLVVADADGVVVVPQARAEEAIRQALVKARAESAARALLADGAFLRDAWDRFGVL
jgi:4-hydroxy-4-methyl-2-oxoglutarate aldolase